MSAISQDITRQKLYENTLKLSEARSRILIDSSPIGIYFRRNNQYELVNQAFCDLTGYTEKEITAPSFDTSEITDPKALITKEYADANYSGGGGVAATGLEAIDEGNGTGWRLIGSDPANYGNIGNNAVDLSYSSNSGIRGSTGSSSVAMGINTTASGDNSTAMGTVTEASGNYSTALGSNSVASGSSSTAMGWFTEALGGYSTAMGNNTTASGDYSTAMGSSTEASGNYSTAIGIDTRAQSVSSFALGRFNEGGGDFSNWNSSDPLFEVGIGTSSITAKNAMTIKKNGITTLKRNNDGDPHLILGGNANTAAGDNCIIASDPAYAGSDLFLRAYDNVVIELDHDNNETGEFEIFAGDGTEVFEVDESGTVRQNGTTIHSSDRRLKQDITNLNYGLNEILKLQPKSYYWKNRKEEKKSLGLIAQEVQPIISEIVNEQDDPGKTLGISYTELIPVLIKAIQEQQSIISNQEEKINELSSKASELKALTQRLEKLEATLNSHQ